jgi:hypothetical protein
MDEWIFADSIHSRSFFVIHAETPRFIADFGDSGGEDADAGEIAAIFEDEALTRWIDPRPEGKSLARLIRQTGESLDAYNAWLDADEAFREAEERRESGEDMEESADDEV